MKILFTGKSDFKYNRVRVLKAGLAKLDEVTVIEFPIKKRKDFDLQKLKSLDQEVDFIYIPPFRHRDVAFIKRHTTKPIVFDPLISKYLTKDDYGHFWKLPFKYLLDKIPFGKADVLLSDTKAHQAYFTEKFNLNPGKVHTLYIGADTSTFYQQQNAGETTSKHFKVGFYGSFVPLQGTDKIIETAKVLSSHEDIQFEIIGGGYTFGQAQKLAEKWQLKNLIFHGNVTYEQLNPMINNFDLCLGIFGDSKKADSVIPNKIYHYATIGKCIITKDTAGIRELFTADKNIILCKSNAESIAAAILALKENPNKIQRIGEEASKLLKQELNEVKIAESFLTILKAYKSKT